MFSFCFQYLLDYLVTKIQCTADCPLASLKGEAMVKFPYLNPLSVRAMVLILP